MRITLLLAALTSVAAFAGTPKATPAVLEKGKSLFVTTCSACHGEHGDGNGPAAAALNPKPRDFHTDEFKQGATVKDIFDTATNGVPGTLMVGFPSLPEDDRWAIAHYVASLTADNPHVKAAKKPGKKTAKK